MTVGTINNHVADMYANDVTTFVNHVGEYSKLCKKTKDELYGGLGYAFLRIVDRLSQIHSAVARRIKK